MSQLTEGCLRRVHESANQEQLSDGVIVQVLEVKKIDSKAGQTGDRYRLVISDGLYYHQSMLVTQLNPLVQSGQLQAMSIIRLNQYLCNKIAEKKVIIMLDVTVLQQTADKIGDPQNIQTLGASGVPQAYGGVKSEGRAQPNFMSNSLSAGPSSATAGGFGGMMGGGAGNVTSFHPIASLNPYHARWTIKARVTAKGDKRVWRNEKGEGSLFSVDLLDAQGGQIKATMFKDAAEKFYDLFQENKVYIISKGQVKPANKQFNRLPNQYELTLNSDAEVIPVDDDAGIDVHRFEFVPIEGIQKIQPGEHVDVIGVVVGFTPVSSITTQKGAQLNKRTVTLMDKTLCQVEVTLWGDQALKWNEEKLADNVVLAIKACKISEFGGRSLSSSFQSQIYDNLDVPESHALRAWYDENRGTLQAQDLQNISKQARSGEGGGAPGGNVRKVLSDIQTESLGMRKDDKPDFFSVRATITFFKHDWEKGSPPWYMACPTDKCNKKVTNEGSGWRCEKCNQTFPNASARYILSLMVCDHTGSTWLTAFNDQAQLLLGGVTADEMNNYKEQGNKATVDEIFKNANFKEYIFKIRCKAEPAQDQEQRVRAHILSATKVNYVTESKALLEEIARYE